MDAASSSQKLMDGIYRHQRHVYDITRRYYLLGRDRLIADLNPPPGGRVLEIGCGTARNLIVAARRYPDARFYGIDISGEMLKSAHDMVARNGLEGQIRMARADATAFDGDLLFSVSGFDRIFFSYSLSMIPGWQAALDCAAQHLAPGGQIHIVDFSAQRGLPSWFSRMLKAWLTRFHVAPRLTLKSELDHLAQRRGGVAHVTTPFRDYAVLARWQHTG